MGLDMYAFSLDRSEMFAKPRDVLNYRAPSGGKPLPQFIVGQFEFTGVPDHGAELLGSGFILPGSTLLYRWRKHPDLHGWMERRWKGMRWRKKPRMFNKEERVPLTVQDLDNLEHTVRQGRLPKTTGFFFGESDGSEQADDLEFIAIARAELAAGKFVYYTSWW